MKKIVCILIILLLIKGAGIFAQNTSPNTSRRPIPGWFSEARFGMFIHWGLYSIPAGKWGNKTDFGEWLMLQARVPRAEYSKLAAQFNPTKFNAEDWVKLAKDAGQKYIIITSKHHDGFALFKSKDPYNVVDASPFNRDIIKEMANACRKYDMKLGLYYSQAQDWYHPGGSVWKNEEWDSTHVASMDKYLDEVAYPQVVEILSNYGDIAVLWWDTAYKMTKERAQKFDELANKYPNMITNNRLGGGFQGDLETPEQFIPATGYPGRKFEVCMTLNNHWGYNAWDDNWKSTRDVIQKLVDITSKGGNFLLNVGPNAYGVIPEVCQNTLRETGEWLKVNGEAIYGTTNSPFPYLKWGRATRKGQKLYLHIFDWPKDGKLIVPMSNKIKNAVLLSDTQNQLKVFKTSESNLIQLPSYAPDKIASVVAIEFEGEPGVIMAPSIGKMVRATSSGEGFYPNSLTDDNMLTVWKGANGSQMDSLEIDLNKTYTIGAMGVIEKIDADGVLNHQEQKFELQYWNGTVWATLSTGLTKGAGIIQSFDNVKAQKFRLILKTDKGEPYLAEWSLYRTE